LGRLVKIAWSFGLEAGKSRNDEIDDPLTEFKEWGSKREG
jgi:hypothetical protein